MFVMHQATQMITEKLKSGTTFALLSHETSDKEIHNITKLK